MLLTGHKFRNDLRALNNNHYQLGITILVIPAILQKKSPRSRLSVYLPQSIHDGEIWLSMQ